MKCNDTIIRVVFFTKSVFRAGRFYYFDVNPLF